MTDEKPTLDEKLRDNRALIAEVQRLTVERDRARDIAVALEQQTAEALDVASRAVAYYDDPDSADGEDYHLIAELFLRRIVRLLSDETETQQ